MRETAARGSFVAERSRAFRDERVDGGGGGEGFPNGDRAPSTRAKDDTAQTRGGDGAGEAGECANVRVGVGYERRGIHETVREAKMRQSVEVSIEGVVVLFSVKVASVVGAGRAELEGTRVHIVRVGEGRRVARGLRWGAEGPPGGEVRGEDVDGVRGIAVGRSATAADAWSAVHSPSHDDSAGRARGLRPGARATTAPRVLARAGPTR